MTLPAVKVPHPHVEVSEEGIPLIRGTKIPVRRLWAWHKRGVFIETLLKRYPSLSPAMVLDSISFAYDNAELIEADLAREEEILGSHTSAVPGVMSQEKLQFSRRK